MALFQRRPQAGDSLVRYSLGPNKRILLVGLGNIGHEYELTRHNVGFLCLEHFADHTEGMSNWREDKKLKCFLSEGQINGLGVTAIRPTTMMNSSGEAVQAVANFYKIQPERVVVVHDELAIPFGKIRTRQGGRDAGNNGIKSVTDHIGAAYGRVRVGIGPRPAEMSDINFVLQRFSQEEQTKLRDLCREVTAILTEYVVQGELPHETRNFLL